MIKKIIMKIMSMITMIRFIPHTDRQVTYQKMFKDFGRDNKHNLQTFAKKNLTYRT